MPRKLKNFLMGALIVILIAASCFTIYFAINNSNNTDDMMIQGTGLTPPEKPGGEINDNSNMEEPPEKPDDESDITSNSNLGEPPEIANNSDENEMMNKPNENGMPNMNNQNSSSNISTVYYVLLVVQGLGISLLTMYLIMSRFNKKKFTETFSSSDKITIYILSIVLITGGLTFTEVYLTNNVFSSTTNNQMMQNGMNENNANISYSGVKEITEDTSLTSGEYVSSEADENAILVQGDIEVSIENVRVDKTGDSDGGDNTSFYGINSAILATSGATLSLKNLNITTNATGANGVFSYGGSATTNNTTSDGTTINISDSTITTKKDNSGGIMTTGGGKTNAYNLTITTSGISSAAIRSDRGGGTVNVDGGTYTTEGSGSPTIYSTAEITVKNANLISKVAEGIVVEGKNSVVIENCDLTASNTKLNGLSTTYKNIFLYQSMSGDADTGNSSFTAKNSKITTNNGDTFYVTNTSSTISLTNNTIINNDNNGNFLRAKADSWGISGSNGGEVTLILTNQKVNGDIMIDNVSTLAMTMNDNSSYDGTINADNTAKSITLKLDKTSGIKLTGDSYITTLDNEDTSNSNIDFNGYKLYINGKPIN
ncbi:MAG: hypothetical protein V8Q75_05180 [Bacilli bacterium]